MTPRQQPPPNYAGKPRPHVVQKGDQLVRIHRTRFDATAFNPTVAAHPLEGGRFDSTPSDPYAYLYAGDDAETAISEKLLRDLPAVSHGARILPEAAIKDLRIAEIEATRDLELVTLRSGSDLGVIGQDTWLTSAPASQYSSTRPWASAIRSWAPWACGMTWQSHREPSGFSYVFFEDRCNPDCFTEVVGDLPLPPHGRALDSGNVRLYLETILTSYNVVLTHH